MRCPKNGVGPITCEVTGEGQAEEIKGQKFGWKGENSVQLIKSWTVVHHGQQHNSGGFFLIRRILLYQDIFIF